MSLASGVTFGALIAYGGYRTSVNPKDFLFLFSKFAIGKQEREVFVKKNAGMMCRACVIPSCSCIRYIAGAHGIQVLQQP